MQRREFVAAAVTPFLVRGGAFGAVQGTAGPALPTAAQLAWLDLEVGMFVHFAPNTWQDLEYDDRSIPPERLPFTADPVQWADTAVALGARYIVMVAKHVGGFCLWQTDSSAYSVRHTTWKEGRGDVMAELAAACATRGLGLGVYLSPRDDFLGAGLSGATARPEAQAEYNAIARQQLTELLTRYGPMKEIWFDGSSVVPVGDILDRHAQGAMVFQGPRATIRWVGNEDGFAPDPVWNALARSDAATGVATALHGDPHGDAWMPLEVDVSIRRPNWFWSTGNAARLLSLDQLVEIYYRSVGRGTQLLLNLPPDRSGRIPEADAARAEAFGNEIRRRFARPVAAVVGSGESVTLPLAGSPGVDHLVLEEDLASGQRILAYRLEGLLEGSWRELGHGSSVGHKRIHPVAPGRYRAVRVTITGSLGRPALRRLAGYRTGAEPPPAWQQGAGIWADNEAGAWTGGALDLDLSRKLDAAAQYRIRFIGRGGDTADARGVVLFVNGAPAPSLLRPEAGRGDVLILTLTGMGQPVRLTGRVDGAAAGTILLRRL